MQIYNSKKIIFDRAPLNFSKFRFTVLLLLLIVTVYPSDIGKITLNSLEDAYLGVSVFVALTLLAFYGAESIFKIDLRQILRSYQSMQVPISSVLGALPGCGGAVIVITAYNSGSVTLGAVVATLTATMGDAAFLLIAKKPGTALFLLPICWLTGIITGYIVDFFYNKKSPLIAQNPIDIARIANFNIRYKLYLTLLAPGLIFGVVRLSFFELPTYYNLISSYVAICGIFLGLVIWATSPIKFTSHPNDPSQIRAVEETCFISTWVIFAFLIFEYTIYGTGFDLEILFKSVSWILPLLAIIVGFIPGCGPQIIVTTMYINGLIPFAALLGNAISNDGDALFPALAINPRIALTATLLSAFPALIVSYMFYFLAPTFLP